MPPPWHPVEMMRVLALFLLLVWSAAGAGADELRGHGGPVRGIAVSQDGRLVATASFDSTVILWSLNTSRAVQVLRFHQGAVNAVAALPDGRFASAGEDGQIALWRLGQGKPEAVFSGHAGPVVALALSPDGQRLASGSWDGSARIWPLVGGEPVLLPDHRANVNGVGFLGDGSVVTVTYDGSLRQFSAAGVLMRKKDLGVPQNSLIVQASGALLLAGGDGVLRQISGDWARVTETTLAQTPLATLAVSADGRSLAAAGFQGALAILREGQPVRILEGPAFPLWSVAFSADGSELLTGGNDRMVRRWSVATGEPRVPVLGAIGEEIPAHLKDHPGATVFRACVACHTLTPDAGNRAGPTLAGLYGRRIGTANGYDFSPALRALSIVWSKESVQKLFELGPAAYTPGTKMPEQTITSAEDRAALAEFLDLVQKK